MWSFLTNFASWIVDFVKPLLLFFQSVIHGFKTLINAFPALLNLSGQAVAYLPSLFAAFVAITVTVLIVFQILGRNAGG